MVERRVSHVAGKTEGRVGILHRPGHQSVTNRLGDDRGGGDSGAQVIAPHDRPVIGGGSAEGESVDQADVRAGLDGGERSGQQAQVGAVKAVAVDGRRRRAEHHHLIGVAQDRVGHARAHLRTQALGVVEVAQRATARLGQRPEVEADRGDHQRPCEAPPPGLIDARNPTGTERAIVGEQARRGTMGSRPPPAHAAPEPV